jgi:hypothetical protein
MNGAATTFLGLCCALFVANPSLTQSGEQPAAPKAAAAAPVPDTATRLHSAWIREVLDLDVQGAIRDYEAIAADTRPANPERWIAVARLFELQRLGVAPATPLPLAEAPEPLRLAIGRVKPIDLTRILNQLTQDPATVEQSLATEAGRSPDLRPVTEVAQSWVRSQQDLFNERYLQRMLANNRGRGPDPDRANAFDVLRRELQGRQEQAAELRRYYFPDFKAPTPAGEPAQIMARVRTNLEAWRTDPAQSQQQRDRLRDLRDAFDARTATDASNLELVKRLPIIADRLLAEPPPGK